MENQSQQQQQQQQQKGGIMSSISSSLSNVKVPQAVKDFGATCSRSYNSMSTGQKVAAGAALAVGAGLLAKSQGWINLPKASNKMKA